MKKETPQEKSWGVKTKHSNVFVNIYDCDTFHHLGRFYKIDTFPALGASTI